jgi:hypothetical protein
VNGIFCVEGQWHRSLTNRSSVLPILELLEHCGRAEFIHNHMGPGPPDVRGLSGGMPADIAGH